MTGISIIIPTLNEAKLAEQTLSQFTTGLKEKYSLEVIVSDGGSTDSTLGIAAKYADKIIHADLSQKQNIASGRNYGAVSASKEILYFFNADTRIPDIEKFFGLTSMQFGNQKVSALTCRVEVFPEEKKLSDKLFHTFYNNYVRVVNVLGFGMGRGECHMLRRNVFNKLNGYDETLEAGEDFDLYRRLHDRKLGKIKFMKELVVYESPRRYRRYGYIKVFFDWTKNAISVVMRNKSISKNWEEVR